MATSKPVLVETTTSQDYEHEIKRSKVEYAFYLVEQPYDWYLADELVSSIGVDSSMKEVLTKLKAILKQAGY